MLEIVRINSESDFPSDVSRSDFVDQLHKHLGQFGDTKEAINKCIDYAFSSSEGNGGFLLLARDGSDAVGAAIINRTGMAEYIPENILVYIAVDPERRGQGFGKSIVERIQSECDGAIALHVEYDNPAKRLYERLGFTSKYAEMRYIPESASKEDK